MSDPMNDRPINSEDLALYAMQLLTEEERAAVAAYLAKSVEARRELAEIQGDLAVFAHTVDLHSPPTMARERFLKQLARERKPGSPDRAMAETRPQGAPVRSGTVFAEAAERMKAAKIEPPKGVSAVESSETVVAIDHIDQPKRSFAGRAFSWAGWAVAAGLAVAAGSFYRERDTLRETLASQTSQMDHMKTDMTSQSADLEAAREVMDTMKDSSAMRVTLTTYKASTAPIGRATYVPSKGALVFLVSNMAPLQPAKTYELWLLPAAEGMGPIPAGMFVPDAHGNASVIMPPMPKGIEAKGFGVTIENEGGSATPTMPIVLSGE
jgi:anti-sigma-K factor RskA